VFLAKGFDGEYVHRLMQLVAGGLTAVLVNGVMGPFFKNGRSLRQGDLISSICWKYALEAIILYYNISIFIVKCLYFML
jgi:hypothetical protein